MKSRQVVTDMVLVFFFLFQLTSCSARREPNMAVPTIIASSEASQANEPVATVAASSSTYQEAPMLAEKVDQGLIPTVGDRLPTNPMLLQPENEIGVYGGQLTIPVPTIGSHISVIGYEPLVRWDAQWLRVIPNLAQVVESSEDATTYTFRLREGLRWSDGRAFTAGDILFWYEAVLMNPGLTPRIPGWLSTNGVPVTVTEQDDYTVTFHFEEPNSLFLHNLAGLLGQNLTRYPRHYMAQFHAVYNAAIDDAVVAAGAADWVELFRSRSEFINPDLPTLNAWVVQTVSQSRIMAERNPFYWKVDTEFNQLPYIDRVVFTQLDSLANYDMPSDPQTAVLLFTEDFEDGALPGVVAENTAETALISSFSADTVINFNLNHSDAALRQIFQNRTFRQALSQGLNRQQILDMFYGGEGEAFQPAPRPESPFYLEALARQYTEYNPTLANSLLDEAGLNTRDAEGFRLRPDGRRLTIRLQTANPSQAPVLNLVQEQWQALGIDAQVIVYENPDDYFQELFANQHDTFISEGAGGLDVMLQPVYYFPLHPFASWYATGWAQWYVDPADPDAIEPPELVRQQMGLYNQLKSTTDSEEQAAFMNQILKMAVTEFYVIGTVLDPDSSMFVSNNLKNVPAVMPLSVVDYPTPAPSNPAQFFIVSNKG